MLGEDSDKVSSHYFCLVGGHPKFAQDLALSVHLKQMDADLVFRMANFGFREPDPGVRLQAVGVVLLRLRPSAMAVLAEAGQYRVLVPGAGGTVRPSLRVGAGFGALRCSSRFPPLGRDVLE